MQCFQECQINASYYTIINSIFQSHFVNRYIKWACGHNAMANYFLDRAPIDKNDQMAAFVLHGQFKVDENDDYNKHSSSCPTQCSWFSTL